MNTILTPCILQTIIICCTIIIITIIAVSAYRIKKGQQRSWEHIYIMQVYYLYLPYQYSLIVFMGIEMFWILYHLLLL